MATPRAGSATTCCSPHWRKRTSRTSAEQSDKMLLICPHCVRTMSTDWREAGHTVEIEHHSELLARHDVQLPMPHEAGRRWGITIPVSGAYRGRL